MGRGGENFYSMRWMKLICHSVIMSHSFSFLWVRNKNMSPRSCQSADHRHCLPQRTEPAYYSCARGRNRLFFICYRSEKKQRRDAACSHLAPIKQHSGIQNVHASGWRDGGHVHLLHPSKNGVCASQTRQQEQAHPNHKHCS